MQQINPEKIYRKLVENMNEAVWMGDKSECTVYANPKFCELMEYTLEEMLDRKSYEFWDIESAEKVKNINLGKRKKGFSSSYEGNLLSKSGKKIPVLLSGAPLMNDQGEMEGTVGIMTDLTVLKEKEKSERILNNAIRHATDAIIIFDKNGVIKSWNKGAKVIFGYNGDEVLENNLSKILPKDEANLITGKNIIQHNIELDGIHKNKKIIKFAATITPVFAEDKKTVSSCLMIARDIVEKAKFEEEIAIKYQKIKDAYTYLGTMRRQMEYIFDLLDLFTEDGNIKSVADFVVTSVIMLTKVDACVLRKYCKKKNTLDLVSCFGVDQDWRGKASIKYNNSLAEKAYKKGMSLKIIDFSHEPRYQSLYLAKKNNLSSLLLIPLKYRNEIVGSLSLYASPDKKLEIFENDFIEKYTKLIEVIIGCTKDI